MAKPAKKSPPAESGAEPDSGSDSDSSLVSEEAERASSAPDSSESAPSEVGPASDGTTTPEQRPKRSIQDRILVLLAVISFGVTGYFLFFGIPRNWLGSLQKIGKITAESPIRRRHSGTLSWQSIRGTQDIYLRDIVYVPKETSAQVELAGKKFTIPADTMVQFDESSIDQFEITLLELKSTNVPIALPQHRAKLSNLLPDITPYELRHSELKSRTFSAIYEAPQLAKAFPMGPNTFSLDKLPDYEIRLLSPAPDRYNLRANRWMQMSWTPVPIGGVSYTLEVSKDSRFRKMLPHKTGSNRLLVQFDDEATFYWRVRGTKEDDETLSEALSFTMTLRGGKTPSLPKIRGLGTIPGGQQ